MSEELRADVRRAIVAPVVSEKSYLLVQAHNQYTFRVLDDAQRSRSARPSRTSSTSR